LGRTTNKTVERKEYVSPEKIITELRSYLNNAPIIPDYLTISGSGEPTLHSRLKEIVSEIKRIAAIPVAVITNSSLLYQDEVKEQLLGADVILPSLDAVSETLFVYLNRPHSSIQIRDIIRGLKELRQAFTGEIWLETVFCLGVNDLKGEVQALKEAIQEINPDKIHLNTVDRPPAEDFVFPLPMEKLVKIQSELGEKAEIIVSQNFDVPSSNLVEREKRILELLRRRPCSSTELSAALGIHPNELINLLENLTKEGKIHYRIYNNQCYYEAN
ncbi:MAG: radical SAM protein, partial [Desulfobacterota bacterium]|nr:radical SAM protein [Thermodesulfobacteriota bacterium]